MIIDTHCHYNLEPLVQAAATYWNEAINHKVVGAICVGTNLHTSSTALELASKHTTMFASIGIHPGEYTEKIKSFLEGDSYSQATIDSAIHHDISQFDTLLQDELQNKDSKLVAIGEIGLDYFWLKTKGLKRQLVENMQKQVFTAQIGAAFENLIPVILHVRDQVDRRTTNAYYDTYEIVAQLVLEYRSQEKQTPPIILHCASGPTDYIKDFLSLGAYIGFAGNITYDNAPELREIFELTPKSRILLETDAPYLGPNEKKGEVCKPVYITKTAQFLQESYGINLDIIVENTLKVFPQFKSALTAAKL